MMCQRNDSGNDEKFRQNDECQPGELKASREY